MFKKTLLLICSTLLMLSSCKKEETTDVVAKLTVSLTKIEFTADEDAPKQVIVSAENTDWDYNCPDAWVTVSRDGSTLELSVSQNTSEASRESRITIIPSAHNINSVTITVTQQGQAVEDPELSASVTSLSFDSSGQSQEIIVTFSGGVEWEVRSDKEWLKATKSGEDKIVAIVEDNDTTRPREASLIIYNTNKTVEISALLIRVFQKPIDVAPSLSLLGLPLIDEDANEYLLEYTHYKDDYGHNNVTTNISTEQIFLLIEPYDATYSVYVTEGSDWFDAVADPYNFDLPSVNPYFLQGRYPEEELTASFTIEHSDITIPAIKVRVHKSAAIYHRSTLDHDITGIDISLSAGIIKSSQQSLSEINLAFTTGNAEFHRKATSDANGNYTHCTGTGEMIVIRLYDTLSDGISEQTFTVNGDKTDVGTIDPGKVSIIIGYGRVKLDGCFYAKISEDNLYEYDSFGLINSGTLKVSKSGEDYTFEWDFESDNGHKITGSYTGPLTLTNN